MFFELNEYDPATQEAWYGGGGGKKIPPGKHVCEVTAAEVKPTKSGDGTNLVLELELIESEDESAVGKTFTNYVYLGKTKGSRQDNEIAWNRLTALCNVVGVNAKGGFDTDAFVGKQFQGIFADEDAEMRKEDGTAITKTFSRLTGYRTVEGNTPAGPPAAALKAAPAAAKRTATVRHLG